MTTLQIILLITAYVLLGLHSVYYLIKRVSLWNEFNKHHHYMIPIAFLLPIITHFATWSVYGDRKLKEWNKMRRVYDHRSDIKWDDNSAIEKIIHCIEQASFCVNKTPDTTWLIEILLKQANDIKEMKL